LNFPADFIVELKKGINFPEDFSEERIKVIFEESYAPKNKL